MTDISKKAVEVLVSTIVGRSPNNTDHDQTRAARTLLALQARVEELESENEKQAEHLLCLGVPKIGPKNGPSDLNDGGFRLIGSDAAVAHFKNLYQNKRLQGLRDAADWIDEMRISNRTAAVNGLRAKALKEQAND
jgi:hypothetical protein